MSDSLATKQDLRELEARIDTRLADLEHRMALRLGGLMVAGIAVVSAFVKTGLSWSA